MSIDMPDYNSGSTEYQAYRARKIWTMNPDIDPIEDGIIVIKDNIIQDIGQSRDIQPFLTKCQPTELEAKIVIPSLINAHTHLELSHLQGRTTIHSGFENWVKSLLHLPLKGIDKKTLHQTITSLQQMGTVCIGDISGQKPLTVLQALNHQNMTYQLFIEFLGFKSPLKDKPQWPKKIAPQHNHFISAAGHALYSTHPRSFQVLKTWTTLNSRPFSLHLAEHPGEVELLTTGRGEFSELMKDLLLPDNFIPPGISPIAYADQLGLLDDKTIAVHCVQADIHDIEILNQRGVFVCLCPRSNYIIGVGRAPWEKLYEEGISLCIGTDGLCSNNDLNLWNEVRFLLEHWETSISLYEIIKWITINPANVLGLSKWFGTLETGKRAAFTSLPQDLVSN